MELIPKKSRTIRYIESIFKDTWKKMYSFFLKHDIHPVLIGGASLSFNGYNRMTEDYDIIVSKEDKEKMNNLPIGYIREISNGRNRRFIFNDGKELIEVIYEGDNLNGNIYPNPNSLDARAGVIQLKDLIVLKLKAKRNRDLADVESLIEVNNLIIDYYKLLPMSLKDLFIECHNNVNKNKVTFN